MRKTILIADDYTGTADAGVHLLAAGEGVTLFLPSSSGESVFKEPPAFAAVDSETRFLSPKKAAEIVRTLFAQARAAGFERFFKKIDSTLRGNPGAETAAALEGSGCAAAIVCPTFPAMGRTCVDGVAAIHGRPLLETEIGRDPFTPLASSRVADILAAQTSLPAGSLPLPRLREGPAAARECVRSMTVSGARLVVADAATDADLDILAAVIVADSSLLPVGSGGLSRAVAAAWAGSVAAGPLPEYRMEGRILAIMGSLASHAEAQTEYALSQGGFALLTLDLDAAGRDAEEAIDSLLREARRQEGKDLILRARPVRPALDVVAGGNAGALLGGAAARLVAEVGCRVLFSAGGATSAALCAALGLDRLALEREILPGTVAGRFRSRCGEGWFVSKAGGFGGNDALAALRRFVVSPADS